MTGLLLSKQERDRFVAYCRREAESSDQMAKQLEKMKVPDAVVKHERTKAMAYAIVASDIDRIEDMEISSS